MQLYLRVTGGKNLKNFWKMSPAELTAWGKVWAEARAESGPPADDGFGGMLAGEEIED